MFQHFYVDGLPLNFYGKVEKFDIDLKHVWKNSNFPLHEAIPTFNADEGGRAGLFKTQRIAQRKTIMRWICTT